MGERIAKWDNIKFFLIYCVVLGHVSAHVKVDSSALKAVHFFIYSFHMPAFIFISGLFSKRTIDNKRYDKIGAYLLIYLFMKAFRLIMNALADGKVGSFNLMYETGVPWFAMMLFLAYLITIFVRKWDRRIVMITAILLGILIGYDKNLPEIFIGQRLFVLYPFFLMGYYVSLDQLKKVLNNRIVKAVSVIGLAVWLLVCYRYIDVLYNHIGFYKGKAGYAALKITEYAWCYRALYYAGTVLIMLAIMAVIPSIHGIWTTWGKRTIQVFALHFPIMSILMEKFHVESYLKEIWPAHYVIFIPIFALLLTIVLSLKIWEPFFNRMMNVVPREKN